MISFRATRLHKMSYITKSKEARMNLPGSDFTYFSIHIFVEAFVRGSQLSVQDNIDGWN